MQRFIEFIKEWTLPVAMATGAVFYFLFAFVPALDKAGDDLSPIMHVLLPCFIFAVLYVTFCHVHLKGLKPVRWHWWVTVIQLVLVTVITVVIKATGATGGSLILGESVLCCVIAPCATAASIVTAKLDGSLEQMASHTFINSLLISFVIPFVFPIVEPQPGMSFIPNVLMILRRVAMVLVLPMVMAVATRHLTPKIHQRICSINDLSFYLWTGVLALVTGITLQSIVNSNASPLLLVGIGAVSLITCLLLFALGRLVGRHLGCPIEGGQGLAQKNTSIAIWLAAVFLNPLAAVAPGCYVLWQNSVNSIELWHHEKAQRGKRP